jgi:hypothetical protein
MASTHTFLLAEQIYAGRLHDNDVIYLLTAVGLSPGGSTHLHDNDDIY